MSKDASPSAGEVKNITEILREKTAFRSFDERVVNNFVSKCNVLTFDPHYSIWRKGDEGELDFMVVLDGCVAVWGEYYGEETVDAFVSKGQILGEYKIVGSPLTSTELITLTNSRLLRTNTEAIAELKKEDSGRTLFESLCKALDEKLRIQCSMLKLRTGRNKNRVAKFLDNFTRSGWRDLTNITGQYEKDNFKISLYFTKEIIEGLMDSEDRVIGPVLRKFIDEEIIRMYKINRYFGGRKAVTSGDFSTNNFVESPYFQFEVLDHTLLLEYTG